MVDLSGVPFGQVQGTVDGLLSAEGHVDVHGCTITALPAVSS